MPSLIHGSREFVFCVLHDPSLNTCFSGNEDSLKCKEAKYCGDAVKAKVEYTEDSV